VYRREKQMYLSFMPAGHRPGSGAHARQDTLHNATAVVPAGAGELVQGQFESGEDFLVTNPINCFSTTCVTVTSGCGLVSVVPPSCTKVQRAVEQTLGFCGVRDRDVHVSVHSDIPVGKGMASSTADVVGAIEATAAALERSLTADDVSRMAISIEPSDGLMYRGVVVYNHRRGRLLERLGCLPDLQQLIIDTGGEVDTVAFNTLPKEYTRAERALQQQALALLREGIATCDVWKIGQGTTLSAQVNQRLLPKTHFEEIVSLATVCGACGVVCAHSGTILSLLFPPEASAGLATALTALHGRNYAVLHARSVINW
jgi:L-threonine kinase